MCNSLAPRSCAAICPAQFSKHRYAVCFECRSLQDIDRAMDNFSVGDTDVWQILYAPICFIVGFRFFFYLALVYKHSGTRK